MVRTEIARFEGPVVAALLRSAAAADPAAPPRLRLDVTERVLLLEFPPGNCVASSFVPRPDPGVVGFFRQRGHLPLLLDRSSVGWFRGVVVTFRRHELCLAYLRATGDGA